MNGRRLRFGVMCDGQSLRAWQFECIRNIIDSGYGTLELIVKHDPTPSPGAEDDSRRPSPKKQLKALLWEIGLLGTDSQRTVDISSLFAKVPMIECRVMTKGKYSQYFIPEDVARITSHSLDFILRFGFNIIRGEILSAAKYGVWSFHHNDEMKYRGSPPCFWEIFNDDPVTGVVLQRLTDVLDGGIILKKGYFKTLDYSLRKAIDQSYMEGAKWPAYVCKYIVNGSLDIEKLTPSKTTAPIYKPPDTRQLWVFIIKLLKNKARRLNEGLTKQPRWNIGVMQGQVSDLLSRTNTPKVDWLKENRKHHFIADPIVFASGGRTYLAFEDNGYWRYNGQIHCATLHVEEGVAPSITEDRSVIQQTHHLSYPYVLVHDGSVYMVPERHQSGEISIYRMSTSPYNWEKVGDLVRGFPGIDPTIFQYDGLWWLFATDGGEFPNAKLYAWYATDLFGEWKEHERNPIKIDVRSSRPAGAPFIAEGRLYRPAQDSSKTYGGRLAINQIVRLTPREFEELTVKEFEAQEPYPNGFHTLSHWGNIMLVDGKRYVFNPLYWVERTITLFRYGRYD